LKHDLHALFLTHYPKTLNHMNIKFIGCFTLVSTGITGQAVAIVYVGHNAWGVACNAPQRYKVLPVL